MKKLALSLAVVVSALTFSGAAEAQQRPAVLIVDTDRILNECTACKAAATQLQSQLQSGRTRAQQLEASLKPEAEALQKAVQAAGGKPDAALQARINAYRTKEQQGQAELAGRENSLQSTQSHVQQQIGTRLVQIVEQSRARRQASIVVAKGNTLASDSTIDITGEVLAALNQQLPAVSVTPLPQQARPQGR
jgi:Skp family chaperone for outer membrane proteins